MVATSWSQRQLLNPRIQISVDKLNCGKEGMKLGFREISERVLDSFWNVLLDTQDTVVSRRRCLSIPSERDIKLKAAILMNN